MKKRSIKLLLVISACLLVILSGIFLTYKYVENKQEQNQLEYIYNIYNDEDRKNMVVDNNSNTVGIPIQSEEDDMVLHSIATLEIPSINFKNIVIEGTNQQALSKGIGLFEHSNILQCNVCLAGHNTTKLLANLKKVKPGDLIKYNSCLGNREYTVETIQEISETDWSHLKNTEDNRITIITCVKGKKDLRLCVQAIEKK